MALTWGPWQPDPTAGARSPYVDWYATTEMDSRLSAGGTTLTSPPVFRWPAAGTGPALPPQPDVAAAVGGLSDLMPLPTHALGGAVGPVPALGDSIGRPPASAVIVGIIDVGLAVAHARFRHTAGGTRFLSVWQQGAAWTGQRHVPHGRDLRADEIATLMTAASGRQGVDEDAFNRAVGSANYADASGDRAIELNAVHGTHVLDLAAGFDPADPGTDKARHRHPIIGVTLPPRPSVGPSGSFLEFFVIPAIDYVVRMADLVWLRHYGHKSHRGAHGFPVVINLSYGLHAGPKDGTMPIQRYLRTLISQRRAAGWAPLRIVMPAGNDNQDRAAARVALSAGSGRHINLRIQPEDRTSGYLEIWSDPQAAPAVGGAGSGGGAPAGAVHPVALSITTPGGTIMAPFAGSHGQIRSLTDTAGNVLARVYCRKGASVGILPAIPRMSYIVCVAPTLRDTGPGAQAGSWQIGLHSADPANPQPAVTLLVQSDQDLTPTATTGRPAYLDDPAYSDTGLRGGLADTYAYDVLARTAVLTDGPGPVLRRGTLNAISDTAETITIAGYRASDGCPAPYSSSGRIGRRAGSGGVPTAAFVSDDSEVLGGRLAAGARSGSTSVMQGTSFATAEATRWASAALTGWHAAGRDPLSELGSAQALGLASALWDAAAGHPVPGAMMPLKIGTGRHPVLPQGRLQRR